MSAARSTATPRSVSAIERPTRGHALHRDAGAVARQIGGNVGAGLGTAAAFGRLGVDHDDA